MVESLVMYLLTYVTYLYEILLSATYLPRHRLLLVKTCDVHLGDLGFLLIGPKLIKSSGLGHAVKVNGLRPVPGHEAPQPGTPDRRILTPEPVGPPPDVGKRVTADVVDGQVDGPVRVDVDIGLAGHLGREAEALAVGVVVGAGLVYL